MNMDQGERKGMDPPPAVTAARGDSPGEGPRKTGRIFAVVLSLASVFLILQAIGAALEMPAELSLNKPMLAVVLFGGSGVWWAFAARGFWTAQGRRWLYLAIPFLIYMVVFWIARSPLYSAPPMPSSAADEPKDDAKKSDDGESDDGEGK